MNTAGSVPRGQGALVLAAAAVGTAALAFALVRKPREAGLALAGALGVVLLMTAIRHRRRLAQVGVGKTLGWVALSMPLAALIGPSLSLPGDQRFFGFRILLIGAVAFSVTIVVACQNLPAWRLPRYVVLLLIWFAWLTIALIWVDDRQAAFRYLFVFATMLVLTIATAYAGSSGRRLKLLVITLGVGFALSIAVSLLEATTGFRLSTSALIGSTKSSSRLMVTSLFVNQNNFATYLAICWPFLLVALLFTRRRLWQAACLLGMVLAALAFLRTGSRSSMLVIGIETLVMVPFALKHSSRKVGRVITVATAMVIVALGAVAFNTSENPLLRQFQFTSLFGNVQEGSGSGAVRVDLTQTGLSLAARSYFLGVGPGNAEGRVREELAGTTTLGNLHDWWLEVFVEGGLPAILLYLLIYGGLLRATFLVASRVRDRFLRGLAIATFVALAGYIIGSFGPSTAISFAPMWILFGLAMAIVVRAQALVREGELSVAPQRSTVSTQAGVEPQVLLP